jgi:ornithine cyclodeaminase/alanine dehydrogenase-like protein (mu-crystallin family)
LRIFSRAETAELLPHSKLVTWLEAGMRLAVQVPERNHHDVVVEGEPVRTLITMPAWDDSGLIGVKLVNVVPANVSRCRPSISATYVIFDSVTGEPMALLDGTVLTARRTAAVAALAGKHLSDPHARTHLIVGAGAVARHLAPAYAAVRSFKRTLVWARRPDRAAEMARELEAGGIRAVAVTDLEEGVRASDVVSCATMAERPIIRGAWLRPGSHLDLLGAYRPNMREADDDALHGAAIYADSMPGALTDAGELADPIERGAIARADILGDLRDLCLNPPQGDGVTRTVFKSVGNARWDYLCASAAWRDAALAAA